MVVVLGVITAETLATGGLIGVVLFVFTSDDSLMPSMKRSGARPESMIMNDMTATMTSVDHAGNTGPCSSSSFLKIMIAAGLM